MSWRLSPVFLLCVLWFSGCANGPHAPLSTNTRQNLGKVYLASLDTLNQTYFHPDFNKGGVGGALKGAGTGVLNGLDSCIDSAIGAGPLGPLVLLVCTPLGISAGVMQGSHDGSQPSISPDQLTAMTTQVNNTLHNADLGNALVATVDEQSQNLPRLADYEMAHGILPAPNKGQTLEQLASQWGYHTLLQINVTKAGFDSDGGQVPMLHFSMTANVLLKNTDNHKTLYANEYHYTGTPQPLVYWFRDDNKLLADEIIKSNRQMANDILGDIFLK